MSDEPRPLTDDERAELEELRAEKARHEQELKARRERAELEELRAEKRQAQQHRASDGSVGASRPANGTTPHAKPAQDAAVRGGGVPHDVAAQSRAAKAQTARTRTDGFEYEEPPMKSAEQLEAEREERERQRIEAIRDKRDAELRERGRKLMEPDDDDLRMPTGQKFVILGVVIIATILVLMSVFGG